GELDGVDRDMSRRLALGVLNIAQGHPKLLELADGQARDPARLAALVEAGNQAWRDAGGLPDGFFATGEASASADDYLQVLAAWTRSITETLPSGEQALFCYLCCLEEPDRDRQVLDGNWAGLWKRLGHDGQPPAIDQALAAIAARGLAAVQHEPEAYAIHPGIAAAGRTQAGQAFRDAADTETAVFWATVFRHASGEADGGGTDTGLLVRAGLAAVPYLTRRQQWTLAGYLLQHAFNAEPSRANAAAVLPAILEIAAHDPGRADVLARVLQVIDPVAAETGLRAYLDDAAARRDHRAAATAAGQLIILCRDSGRLAEALTLADQKAEYTRQAGLGPWTQLGGEVQRLQVLNQMGQARQVLAEVQRLRDHLPALPATPGPNETATPWNVREVLLGTGREAALWLGQWDDALDLSAAVIASKRERRAPAADIGRGRFSDYGPLLRLGRAGEALDLLLECRQAFQDANDIQGLGAVLSALADTETARGHGDAAIRLEHDALRYKYLARDVTAIAVSYHNLGNHLHRHARQPAQALACHLAAALIRALTGADDGGQSLRAAGADLRASGPDVSPPADITGLCRQVGEIPGADLGRLLAALAPEPGTAEQALRQLIEQIQVLIHPQDTGARKARRLFPRSRKTTNQVQAAPPPPERE
ncbi:MAG TPA: hypothetical protein VN771_05855, partial [Candidatus Baltobacteraceae bacterium]|nr:hypothetical protein [Candidatus Baltobacteraceae bacterium]